MELNEDYLQRACEAFDAARGTHMQPRSAVVAAIGAYLTEMFKPGSMMTLEPLEATPQRDYRKELWIGVATAVARSDATTSIAAPANWANRALAEFDATFPQEPTHG